MSILAEKHILLGITGSIAAYKAVEVASKLTQAGAQVDVILTPAAEKFLTPLTFESVTGRKAFTDSDLWGGQAHVLHVGLGHSADLLVIAPCTANTIAKLAYGLADKLLTVRALASQCPLLIAPAMDVGIYSNPATQENVRILAERQVYFAGPVEGRMASGLTGLGRFVEPAELLGHIRLLLGRNGPLAGKKVIVTAGGSQEPLDPVRVLTNRSSGKQGYAVAQAAVDAGATVVLISAPTALTPPIGARLVEATTVQAMLEAVLLESSGADALVMAAAAADFRAKKVAANKRNRREGIPQLELEAAPDIRQAVSKQEAQKPRLVIGFAAESQDLLENARSKMESKKLDLLVANDISAADAGFGVDTNRVTLLYPGRPAEPLPLMNKSEVAEAIIARLTKMLEST